jgi:Kef-type K+ transport system membrane component KefB
MHRHTIVAFVFCLFLSFAAEEFFGVADITGAFLAGLVLSNTKRSEYLASKFDVLSYLYLSPIFFASIGLTVTLPKMSGILIAFSIVLAIVAVITKIAGCGLGAKMCGYKNHQCLQIGVGMISRGEVALIVASKGAAVGLLSDNILGPVIVVVVITTIITPVLLKIVYKDPEGVTAEETNLPNDEGFANRFNDVIRLREGEDDDIFGMY